MTSPHSLSAKINSSNFLCQTFPNFFFLFVSVFITPFLFLLPLSHPLCSLSPQQTGFYCNWSFSSLLSGMLVIIQIWERRFHVRQNRTKHGNSSSSQELSREDRRIKCISETGVPEATDCKTVLGTADRESGKAESRSWASMLSFPSLNPFHFWKKKKANIWG